MPTNYATPSQETIPAQYGRLRETHALAMQHKPGGPAVVIAVICAVLAVLAACAMGAQPLPKAVHVPT